MREKSGLIIALVVVSMFAAGAVFAGQGACASGEKERGGHYKEKTAAITASLKLTPDQEKRLNEAKTGHRAEMAELARQLKEARQELKTALANPAVTKQGVEPIAVRIKAFQASMVDRRIDGILKIKEILTPEQYQKLQGMKEGRRDKARGKRVGRDCRK
jgi:Spy/CpxP family protein refolding chaperone